MAIFSILFIIFSISIVFVYAEDSSADQKDLIQSKIACQINNFSNNSQKASHSHAIFAPGTPQEYVDSIDDAPSGDNGEVSSNFVHRGRWGSTATDNFGLAQGDPTTITWSIVPDGTAISSLGGISGESTDPSNLVEFMGGIYGVTSDDTNYTDEPWFPHFQNMFDRLSELSGITYVYEPNDDGERLSVFWYNFPGELGVRGDVRIGGHAIDGNSGVLAYNFFPSNGEMVIDTSDNYYSNVTNNSLRLRNIVAHEAGHGMGLDHVVSNNANT